MIVPPAYHHQLRCFIIHQALPVPQAAGRHLCMPSFSTLGAQPPSYERDAIPDIIWQLSHSTLEA